MFLDGVKDFVKNSKVAQFGLTLLAGVAVGAIFYPTKHIEKTVEQKFQQEISKINEQHSSEVKTLNEQITTVTSQMKKVTTEKDTKISQLTTQVTNLKSSQKSTYYKIVHPDGTVEIKKTNEKDVEESTKIVTQIQQEFKEKVDQIETKWETIHKNLVTQLKSEWSQKEQDYQKTISELKTKEVVDINPKKYGMEVGATSNASYYIHPTADLFGPIFIGMHGQIGTSQELGLGIGLRF